MYGILYTYQVTLLIPVLGYSLLRSVNLLYKECHFEMPVQVQLFEAANYEDFALALYELLPLHLCLIISFDSSVMTHQWRHLLPFEIEISLATTISINPLICSSLNIPASMMSASSCVPRFHLNTSGRYPLLPIELLPAISSFSGFGTKWTWIRCASSFLVSPNHVIYYES